MSALLEEVLTVIRARRDEFEARYGVRLIGVVGSVARGEERADSDVDITYETPTPTTLFRIAAVINELEDQIGRKVDLVDLETVRPEGRAWMEEDLVRA